MSDRLVMYCKNTLDLENAKLGDEYYYSSLPLCVIDAVFSIGVRYASTKNVVRRYCDNYNLTLFREKTSEYPDIESQHTISQLLENINDKGIDYFTSGILRNHQRTSTRSGILKTEAVCLWTKIFNNYGIEVFQDVIGIGNEINNEILKIKGQHSGISLSYFYMLSGNDDLCKPDRHIRNFLSIGLQREVYNIDEIQFIMSDAVDILRKTYPNLTVRVLDHAIWAHMSKKQG